MKITLQPTIFSAPRLQSFSAIIPIAIFWSLISAGSTFSQSSVFNTQKAAWLARGGKFLDNVSNDASRAFALLESDAVGANQPWF